MCLVKKIITLLFSISLSSSLFAQNLGSVVNYFKIDAIEILGLSKIEKSAVLEKMKLHEGDTATNYSIRNDIRAIYDLNFFEKVEILKKNDAGKNKLIVQVSEKRVIDGVLFKGNSEISDSDLTEKLATKKFKIYDISVIQKDIREIQKLYEDKGYYLVEASHEVVKKTNGEFWVQFNVREGQKIQIKKINFIGNKEISSETLKAFMQTQEKSLFSFMSGKGTLKEYDFDIDIKRLKYFYSTKGFIQANLGKPIVTVSNDKKWIFITAIFSNPMI